MRRKLFTFCSVLSLVLCTAVCAVWVRSLWKADIVYGRRGPAYVMLWSNFGSLKLLAQRDAAPGGLPEGWGSRRRGIPAQKNARDSGLWHRWGLGTFSEGSIAMFASDDDGTQHRLGIAQYVEVPYWLVVVVVSIPAAAWAGAVLRRRTLARRRSNLCPSCGYNMRATPDRCPECGKSPPHNTPMHRTVPAV